MWSGSSSGGGRASLAVDRKRLPSLFGALGRGCGMRLRLCVRVRGPVPTPQAYGLHRATGGLVQLDDDDDDEHVGAGGSGSDAEPATGRGAEGLVAETGRRAATRLAAEPARGDDAASFRSLSASYASRRAGGPATVVGGAATAAAAPAAEEDGCDSEGGGGRGGAAGAGAAAATRGDLGGGAALGGGGGRKRQLEAV